MTLVLGVDGGGSRTRAALCQVDQAGALQTIARGSAPGSNPLSVGWESAQAAIVSAIAEATRSADGPPAAAVLAVAGCGSETARERLAAWAGAQGFAATTRIVPDTEPVLASAPAGEAAVGLIAGTGSSALARRPDGSTEIVGGWGYLIDDAGSGYALGRDAMRRLSQLSDAGAALDALSGEIVRHAGVERPAEIKAALYGAENPRAWVAGFAPTVLRLSEAGDAIARQITAENVTALARLALDAAARVAAVPADKPLAYLAGGLVTGSEHYRRLILEALTDAGWQPDRVIPAVDGATGCALLAAKGLRD